MGGRRGAGPAGAVERPLRPGSVRPGGDHACHATPSSTSSSWSSPTTAPRSWAVCWRSVRTPPAGSAYRAVVVDNDPGRRVERPRGRHQAYPWATSRAGRPQPRLRRGHQRRPAVGPPGPRGVRREPRRPVRGLAVWPTADRRREARCRRASPARPGGLGRCARSAESRPVLGAWGEAPLGDHAARPAPPLTRWSRKSDAYAMRAAPVDWATGAVLMTSRAALVRSAAGTTGSSCTPRRLTTAGGCGPAGFAVRYNRTPRHPPRGRIWAFAGADRTVAGQPGPCTTGGSMAGSGSPFRASGRHPARPRARDAGSGLH